MAALVGCTMMVGCASQPDNQLKLDGTINGYEGEWIHLAYTVRDTVQVTDSTRIANGAFRFSRPMEVPVAQSHAVHRQSDGLPQCEICRAVH